MRSARAPQHAGEPSTAAVMCRLCLLSLTRGTSATLRAPLASRVLHDSAQRWEFLGHIFEHASLFARKSGFATACPGRLINVCSVGGAARRLLFAAVFGRRLLSWPPTSWPTC